jgi:basic membrane lipoprotein Med (substrate-binding protein (PBP1-ABC) superfamily)
LRKRQILGIVELYNAYWRSDSLISREDFIFAVGFEGNTAIVNAAQKRAYGKLPTLKLAEKGLFKAAVCSAVYEKNNDELKRVLAIYNENNEKSLDSVEALKRTFGVLETFEMIDKVLHA